MFPPKYCSGAILVRGSEQHHTLRPHLYVATLSIAIRSISLPMTVPKDDMKKIYTTETNFTCFSRVTASYVTKVVFQQHHIACPQHSFSLSFANYNYKDSMKVNLHEVANFTHSIRLSYSMIYDQLGSHYTSPSNKMMQSRLNK